MLRKLIVRKINSQNLFADAQGRIIPSANVITNGDNIISINSANGISKTIMSGTRNGEPYVRTIIDRIDGKYRYHNDITHNLKTNTTEKIQWKLDVTDPNAQPEIIRDKK